MKNFSLLNYEVENKIVFITLNRAEKRNALNYNLIEELRKALKQAAKESTARAIVIRAYGDVFSAGADLESLKEMQKNSRKKNLADSVHLKEMFLEIYEHRLPVIAQVEGHAIAGGCGLATVCDFVFAVPEAQFGYTEVRIGFIPAIVMVFLIRKIGEGRVKELMLTGKLISAATAKDFGLINFISEKNKIAGEVKTFAQKLISETSPNSIQQTKKLMASINGKEMKNNLQLACEMNADTRASNDCKMGVSSFLKKEKLDWNKI